MLCHTPLPAGNTSVSRDGSNTAGRWEKNGETELGEGARKRGESSNDHTREGERGAGPRERLLACGTCRLATARRLHAAAASNGPQRGLAVPQRGRGHSARQGRGHAVGAGPRQTARSFPSHLPYQLPAGPQVATRGQQRQANQGCLPKSPRALSHPELPHPLEHAFITRILKHKASGRGGAEAGPQGRAQLRLLPRGARRRVATRDPRLRGGLQVTSRQRPV